MAVQGRQVLVLDDDDTIRAALRFVLEDDGYAVTEATDGAAALAVLRASPDPVVALLDLMMPGVDGFAVVETVASDEVLATRHAYIILSAASTSKMRRVADALTGLHAAYIRKPFDIDHVLATVADAADHLA